MYHYSINKANQNPQNELQTALNFNQKIAVLLPNDLCPYGLWPKRHVMGWEERQRILCSVRCSGEPCSSEFRFESVGANGPVEPTLGAVGLTIV